MFQNPFLTYFFSQIQYSRKDCPPHLLAFKIEAKWGVQWAEEADSSNKTLINEVNKRGRTGGVRS